MPNSGLLSTLASETLPSMAIAKVNEGAEVVKVKVRVKVSKE